MAYSFGEVTGRIKISLKTSENHDKMLRRNEYVTENLFRLYYVQILTSVMCSKH